MAYVREAREQDALDLAPRLRPVDAKECRVLGNHDPETALLLSFRSGASRTIIADDGVTPIGMFGAAPTPLPGCGSAWLLATDDLTENRSHRSQFLRQCPLWIFWMHTMHPVLFNLILAENTTSIRWLKWMGFTFFPTVREDILLFRRYHDV